jgi:hypothetical protein
LCQVCNEDILDEEEYGKCHGPLCSNFQKQRRGETAPKQWIALFRKLSPAATKLPPQCKLLSAGAEDALLIVFHR